MTPSYLTKIRKAIIISLLVHGLASSTFAQAPTPIIRPADYEYLSAPDSLGVRHKLRMPEQRLYKKANAQLPYPIIFIHGLIGSSITWDSTTDFMDAQYGFTFGGRMDFCLNYDGDLTKANMNFYPTTGADLALFTNPSNLNIGDYYYLNFDVGSDGSFKPSSSSSYYVKSNQSAIYKQGLALKWAIYYILKITGKDKVILMGHSMGGLTAREYLQNSNLWQSDGKHHVAKLVTTGTPHGGSNSTMFGIGLSGMDEKSDAVRDLRRSYAISGANGVYLFGGKESNSVMNNNILFNYENVDVNCNENYGDTIKGLNKKNIYTNLDYSCIIGVCSGCLTCSSCDGVVGIDYANLNNYYSNLTQNLFYYNASGTIEIHQDLTKQNYQNMQGLDEPNYSNLAYNIGFDTTYNGFITVQSTNYTYYPTDYDWYKFSIPAKSNVRVSIGNIYLSNLWVAIIDSSNNLIDTIQSSGKSYINFTRVLNGGKYYFVIYGTPTSTSFNNPYTFKLNKAPLCDFKADKTTGTTPLQINFSDLSTESPTSWSWTFSGGNPSSSTSKNPVITYNTSGTYSVTLTSTNQYGNNSMTKINYIIVTCLKPKVSFTNNINGKTVTLTNNSTNATSYNWDFGDGQYSSSSSPVHTYNNSGNYTISLTAINACGDSISKINIVIAPAPTANFSANLTSGNAPLLINFIDNSTNLPTSWQWTFTGGNPPSSILQNPVITYNSEGIYSVTLLATNASGNNSITKTNYITVNPATGIEIISKKDFVKVFPNPNDGIFKVESNFESNTILEIHDIVGKNVLKRYHLLRGINDLDVTELNKGIYLIVLNVDGNYQYERLIIR